MEDGPAEEEEEEGGGGDGEGWQQEWKGPADEGGTSGFHQIGDGVDPVDPAEQSGGGDGIDDRGGIHGELAEDADCAADVGVEHAYWREDAADGRAKDDHGDVAEGEE